MFLCYYFGTSRDKSFGHRLMCDKDWGGIMKRSSISIEDQEKMQGIYNSDKKLTYDGIAELYRKKYPKITGSMVGTLIRERNKNNEPYVGMQDKVKNPLEFVDKRVNTQRQRKG